MSEMMIYKLLDLALSAIAVGVERQLILDKVREMEVDGKSAEYIADALRRMRDEAIEIAARA